MSDDTVDLDSSGEEPEVAEATPGEDSDFVNLPSGEELSLAAAELVVAARPTHLIAIAGPVDCGKTTLLTAIYESFQWGNFAGYQFVASDTFPAFERRCFLSRITSGRDEPETGRTPIGDAAFLHLRVSPEGDSQMVPDLLLTDLSGETFRQARDQSDEGERLEFLARADHLVLLIDGKKFAAPRTRWSVVTDSLTILQTFLDNGVLSPVAHIEVLFSKWDFVTASPDLAPLEELAATIEKQFRDRFETRVGRLRFGRIAARPRRGSGLTFAHGLDVIFQDWLTTSPRLRKADLTMRVEGRRESERFLTRHFCKPSTQI